MPVPSLLPPANATLFMRSIEQAIAQEPCVVPGVELIPNVKGRQLPSFLSFLIYDYGLFELAPFVTNPYVLLDEGRHWLIERDTFAAIARGLGWVENPGEIVEAPGRRTWWNNFQVYFEALPPSDDPALEAIDRVTQLGKPFRSDFRRGVFDYDAPALEAGFTRLTESLLAHDSGVRLRDGGPLWSFGRVWERIHTLTEAEGLALGNWVPHPDPDDAAILDHNELPILGIGATPIADDAEEPILDDAEEAIYGTDLLLDSSASVDFLWVDANFLWAAADYLWADIATEARKLQLATWFGGHRAHVVFRDGANQVLGYRRARVLFVVEQDDAGPYEIDETRYQPNALGGLRVFCEAMTDAGDLLAAVASMGLVIDGTAPAPGQLWVEPGDLTGGVEIAAGPVTIPARQTVRERVKFMLRF